MYLNINELLRSCFECELSHQENFHTVDVTFCGSELLEFFMILSQKKENFKYLQSILPLIYEFFYPKWVENVPILVFQLIYCLISHLEWKELIKKDINTLKHLIDPLIKNSMKLKCLWENIEYKLNENHENLKEKQILISFHHSDDKKVFEKLQTLPKIDLKENLLLLLESKSKLFNKTIWFFFK